MKFDFGKVYQVRSRSQSGFRKVTVKNGHYNCNCPATKECYHIRKVKQWKKDIKGNPEKCWYSNDTRNLEEHHIHRGADRKFSLTVWLTHWIHEKATHDKEFENHITNLFYTNMKKQFKFEATIGQVSFKNLVSNDKSIRITAHTTDIEEAIKTSSLSKKDLVKVYPKKKTLEGSQSKIFAVVVKTVKQNYKTKDNMVDILLEASGQEVPGALYLASMKPKSKIIIEHDQNTKRIA